jgi:glycosyltransferase 2 family protein
MTGGRRLAIVQICVSLAALAAVVWWALRQDRPTLPQPSEAFGPLLIALALYAAATLARGERWHRILRHTGVRARRAHSYQLTTVGYMGNNVLPARSGDLLRVFLLAPLVETRKRRVLGTVVAERLLDAAALAVVFLALAYGVLSDARAPGGLWPLAAALAALALTAGLVVTARLLRRSGALTRLREVVRPLSAPTRELASGHGAALLALSLALWTLEAGVYLAVGRAVDVELGLLGALYVVALTNLFALVPAAPGYVGTFDAAVLFALGSLGATGSEALSYLVLLRFVLFVPITVVGLGFLLARYGGWSRYRAARLETPAAG